MAEFVSAKEAVSKIRDHDTVALGGFGAYGAPDVSLKALATDIKRSPIPGRSPLYRGSVPVIFQKRTWV